jgi:Leucine-rich repeat (LRR) protein
VLSLRENELMEIPEELGQLTDLTVLDLVGNRYVL